MTWSKACTKLETPSRARESPTGTSKERQGPAAWSSTISILLDRRARLERARAAFYFGSTRQYPPRDLRARVAEAGKHRRIRPRAVASDLGFGKFLRAPSFREVVGARIGEGPRVAVPLRGAPLLRVMGAGKQGAQRAVRV